MSIMIYNTFGGNNNMKKFFKLLLILFVIIFTVGVIAFIAFSIDGYNMYQKALKEKGIEQRIEEIRTKKDYVTLDKIPVQFKNAIVSIEDHRFEEHGAVDLISIGRAIYRNIIEFDLIEGGSTITQQFAKNTFFTQERKFSRKMAEIFASIDLEKIYSKNDIIEMYMNTIYFGDGYYGIGQASRGYFNKEPIDLTFDELTLLAGIPNAPSIYSLSNSEELARQRQKQVINSMIEHGYLKEDEI